ncbi:conserved hypothetical protein [Chloroflexus aggregans DSM 9485]|uniref:Uncharacterized protein n=1 Tax=Chloroflexus aggregans (strain MD-66 / DSM 9485) TaxID=326427 RepID=B8GB52_CHLAD|nr:conserved hypothetical protein [Chloroflexus aggregans DSM 9485]
MRPLKRLRRAKRIPDGLPPNSFVPLLTERRERAGVLPAYADAVRKRLLGEVTTPSPENSVVRHRAASTLLRDRLDATAGDHRIRTVIADFKLIDQKPKRT